jgi:predicted DsbA family dithiol-disulfide isomerase
MHDALFAADAKSLDARTLREIAIAVGLDVARFDTCLDGETEGKVRRDVEFAAALAVTGTPTFFVGVRESDSRVRLVDRVSGSQPVAWFDFAVEQLLGLPAADAR